jgi:hypothetical protein
MSVMPTLFQVHPVIEARDGIVIADTAPAVLLPVTVCATVHDGAGFARQLVKGPTALIDAEAVKGRNARSRRSFFIFVVG